MSILLEALRKSEKNQHVREAPTIHSDQPSESVSERLPTGPLAMMLIAALFVIGWLVWRQYQPPEGSYQPPVDMIADKTNKVSKPVDVEKQGEQVEPVASSPTVINTAPGQARTPVESYQPPDTVDTSTTVAQEPTKGDADNTIPQLPNSKPVRAEQKTRVNIPDPTPEPVATEPESFHPGEPEPIGYWELPDAVRADVPEIKFSVLVYAADPADRFVLINGQRLGEGDTAQQGLEVKEIRRDGVVFSYRLYQFLVER